MRSVFQQGQQVEWSRVDGWEVKSPPVKVSSPMWDRRKLFGAFVFQALGLLFQDLGSVLSQADELYCSMNSEVVCSAGRFVSRGWM